MNIKCKICKKQFKVPKCREKIAIFCSHKCYWKSKKGKAPSNHFKKGNIPWNKGKEKATCKICGIIFNISPYRKNKAKYCSYKCYWKSKKGQRISSETEYKNREENRNWKGGKIKCRNRISILNPTHPFANSMGYILEHRLVAERYIGRYLLPTEIVHHIDFNSLNNNPNNLYIFKSNSKHRIFHGKNNIHPIKSNLLTYS